MPKQIVWIAGGSASGKETFIKQACAHPAAFYKLGWAATTLTCSQSSLNFIGQFDNDPIAQQRDKILTEVPSLLRQADTVLIKWQIDDSEDERPQKLKKLLLHARHRVIELWAPEAELIDRVQHKAWWKDGTDAAAFVQKEQQLVLAYMKALRNDFFEYTAVDSSAQGDYAILDQEAHSL